MDRFGRGGAPVAVLKTLFEREGIKLDFASQRFEEGPLGELLQEVLAAIAGFERSQILRRTQAGRRKRVERGERLPGKKPPYGYRYNDTLVALVVEPGEATIVRRIFREAAEGRHTRAIARGGPWPTLALYPSERAQGAGGEASRGIGAFTRCAGPG